MMKPDMKSTRKHIARERLGYYKKISLVNKWNVPYDQCVCVCECVFVKPLGDQDIVLKEKVPFCWAI